jgi:uncharacterized membrane protein
MPVLPSRAKFLAIVVIVTNLAGNTLLSVGMRGTTGVQSFLSPAVLAGVSLLILWTLLRATLLSWADLSYVLPVTAIGYVLTALTGKLLLNEAISSTRWIATLLIVSGVVLAGSTTARTTDQSRE